MCVNRKSTKESEKGSSVSNKETENENKRSRWKSVCWWQSAYKRSLESFVTSFRFNIIYLCSFPKNINWIDCIFYGIRCCFAILRWLLFAASSFSFIIFDSNGLFALSAEWTQQILDDVNPNRMKISSFSIDFIYLC